MQQIRDGARAEVSTTEVSSGVPSGRAQEAPTTGVLRFWRSERAMHWAIAVPFVTCWVSAVLLIDLFNHGPLRPLRGLISWTHRLSGVALIVMPLAAAAVHRIDFRVHIHNVKEAWRWTLDDLRWLARMALASVNKRIALPEQGKFNAAEKLNFMTVMTTWPLFIATGIAVWLPGVAYEAWILHCLLTLVVTPLMLGHIFMATVNPDTRVGLEGMVSGVVDRKWARHHYTRWYRASFDREDELETGPDAETPAQPIPAGMRIHCPSCGGVTAIPPESLVAHIEQPERIVCRACGERIDAFA